MVALSTGPATMADAIQTAWRLVDVTQTIARPANTASAARHDSDRTSEASDDHATDTAAQASRVSTTDSPAVWRTAGSVTRCERSSTTRTASSAAATPARSSALPAGKNVSENAGIHSATPRAGERTTIATYTRPAVAT